MNDDLASGFKNVDGATDFAVFSSCLTLVDSMPFFAECKRESYDLLGATPGRRILDVGCGLGDDAAVLAKLVSPGGAVVAVDGSRSMIEAARKRHGDVSGLTFEVAEAAALPFADASLDACRIDRVLQHIADPSLVIREMARVLRPGGLLVAYDNDWETLTVDAGDRELTRTVLNAWCDRFPSGWIGRQLVPLFLRAGLRDVVAFPKTLVLRDLETADRLYCFFTTVERLAETDVVSREATARWSEGLRAADREGRFFSSYTGFLVCGTRANATIDGAFAPRNEGVPGRCLFCNAIVNVQEVQNSPAWPVFDGVTVCQLCSEKLEKDAPLIARDIDRCLSMLTSIEREVLTLRYGLLDRRHFSFDEIAERLGISALLVAQIEQQALEKARSFAREDGLD